MKCPICEGEGGWTDYMEDGVPAMYWKCPLCVGAGKLGLGEWLKHKFWNNVPIRFLEWYGDLRWPIEKTSNDN